MKLSLAEVDKINHEHSGATSLFTNAIDLKCVDPTIFPVTYASTFLLAAVAVFSDLNMGCCDDHGVPLFVLSLLGSHDSVSLPICAAACPVLSNIHAFSQILQIYLQAAMRSGTGVRLCKK